jgi:hypothetical protein
MLKTFLLLTVLAFSIACGGSGAANSSKPAGDQPTPVGALMNEYKTSKDAMVAKYTGKNLTVVGYTITEPIMPKTADDIGILIIQERGGDTLNAMTCHFKLADKADFEGVSGDQRVVLNGTFSDDISTGLKACKRIKTE